MFHSKDHWWLLIGMLDNSSGQPVYASSGDAVTPGAESQVVGMGKGTDEGDCYGASAFWGQIRSDFSCGATTYGFICEM